MNQLNCSEEFIEHFGIKVWLEGYSTIFVLLDLWESN